MNPPATPRPRLLFICARNQWRSPTAEQIYRADPRLEVRSAGLSEKSRHQVSAADLAWADLVLVMEHGQKSRLRAMFQEIEPMPAIEVLDIPDEYEYMNPELVELLSGAVELILYKISGVNATQRKRSSKRIVER